MQRLLHTRRKGVGGSDIAYVATSREQREPDRHTDRQNALKSLAKLCKEVLPFLRGEKSAPNCTVYPQIKLCTEAICCLLGVSRNFLYRRKPASHGNICQEEELSSIVDDAGARQRQYRRCGLRKGYPDVSGLTTYQCGCESPCFAELPLWRLHNEYRDFSEIARQLNPRRKENRYLLNVKFCPLSNSPVSFCDNSLATLYTVSEGVISDIRTILNQMCTNPSIDRKQVLLDGCLGYRKNFTHRLNKFPDSVREKVETNLDMIIRPDPGASDGVNVCRV